MMFICLNELYILDLSALSVPDRASAADVALTAVAVVVAVVVVVVSSVMLLAAWMLSVALAFRKDLHTEAH